MRVCQYITDLPNDGTDVTQQLLALIASYPDGTSFQFPDERYHVEGSVRVIGRNGLTFEGGTFYATATGTPDGGGISQRRHWWFENCDEITVRGVQVESTNIVRPSWDTGGRAGYGGYKPIWEFEHGLAFHECNGVLVEDCSTYGTWGDGVYVGNSVPGCSDMALRRVDISWNGRQGIGCANAVGLLIEDCVISNSRRSGIDLEPGGSIGLIRNVEIKGTNITSIHPPFAVLGNGNVSDIYIHNNTMAGPAVPVLVVAASDGTRRSNWRFEDNVHLSTGLGSPVYVLKFKKVDGVSIKRNVLRVATTQGRKCVSFDNCLGTLEVIDNDFRPGGCHMEAINGSSVPTIAGNQTACP
jgi:hypothetical protein